MTTVTERVTDTHVESRPPIGSGRRDPQMAQALQRFYDAHTAAEQARADLTRAQASGHDPLPPGVEFLFESANSAWQELLALAGEDREWACSRVEADLGRVSAREYTGRRRRGPGEAVTQSGPLDWSQAGRAA